MTDRSINEILNELNELRVKNGKAPLKDGKAGKGKLLAQLEKEKEALPAEAPSVETLLKAGRCPFCSGDASSQTAAGAEGTFLGDSCNMCHECGKSYNIYTGEEIHLPERKTKKRVVLNPQSKIDAKVEALHEIGAEVHYDRPSRLWHFSTRAGIFFSMSSRQFSEYSPEELAKYAALNLGLAEKSKTKKTAPRTETA